MGDDAVDNSNRNLRPDVIEWARSTENEPKPLAAGGETEQRLRDQFKLPDGGSARIKADNVEGIIRNLCSHPDGARIAEIIASGNLRHCRGYSDQIANLAKRDETSLNAAIEQIRLGQSLFEAGVRDIEFELKGEGNDLKPGVRTGDGTDIDVLARDNNGRTYAYQLKSVANPKKIFQKVDANMYQLQNSGADVRVFVVDTAGTLEEVNMHRVAERLGQMHSSADVQILIRTVDGHVVRVPADGIFSPGEAES